MSAISFAECDGCGRTQPEQTHGPIRGLVPMDWYEVQTPRNATVRSDNAWACSLECMVQIVLAMHAEQCTPGWWALEPMAMPGSAVAHAFSFRGGGVPSGLSMCSAVRSEQCEPASRPGLRPCKRCAHWADRVEPGWFGVPDSMLREGMSLE